MVLALAAMASSPAAAQTADVFFDAFLFDNAGQPATNFNGFIQWEVTDGTVDLLGGNVPGAINQANGRFVDLDGSTDDAGQFATREELTFLPDTLYNLSFDYKSSNGEMNGAIASIDSLVFPFSADSPGLLPFSQDFSFDTATSAKLIFQDVGNDSAGTGIDNIQIVQILPEPAFAGLAAMAVLVVLARRSRRI